MCAGVFVNALACVHAPVCTYVCMSVCLRACAAWERSRLKRWVTWELLLDRPYLGFGFLQLIGSLELKAIIPSR